MHTVLTWILGYQTWREKSPIKSYMHRNYKRNYKRGVWKWPYRIDKWGEKSGVLVEPGDKEEKRKVCKEVIHQRGKKLGDGEKTKPNLRYKSKKKGLKTLTRKYQKKIFEQTLGWTE